MAPIPATITDVEMLLGEAHLTLAPDDPGVALPVVTITNPRTALFDSVIGVRLTFEPHELRVRGRVWATRGKGQYNHFQLVPRR